jgi:hypothetical protein
MVENPAENGVDRRKPPVITSVAAWKDYIIKGLIEIIT